MFPTLVIACTVRCGPDGIWTVLDDAGHSPYGCAKVETLSDRVRVWYVQPLTFVTHGDARRDETYMSHGIDSAASVGLSYVDIRLTKDTAPVPRPFLSPGTCYVSGANVWVRVEGVPATA